MLSVQFKENIENHNNLMGNNNLFLSVGTVDVPHVA